MRVANCTLGVDELSEQLDRYRQLGRHAARVERHPRQILVQFEDDVPVRLVERTMETERRCCPFFALEFDAATRSLAISVDDAGRQGDLDALAQALARG
jgi:hypothetical protein